MEKPRPELPVSEISEDKVKVNGHSSYERLSDTLGPIKKPEETKPLVSLVERLENVGEVKPEEIKPQPGAFLENYFNQLLSEIEKLSSLKEAEEFYDKEIRHLFLGREINKKAIPQLFHEAEIYKLPNTQGYTKEEGVTPELIKKIEEIKKAYDEKRAKFADPFVALEDQASSTKDEIDNTIIELQKAKDKQAEEARSLEIKRLQKNLTRKTNEIAMLANYGPMTRLFNMAYKRKLEREAGKLKEEITRLRVESFKAGEEDKKSKAKKSRKLGK
jgi:hypothetical protein